jgi:hypothetical protein
LRKSKDKFNALDLDPATIGLAGSRKGRIIYGKPPAGEMAKKQFMQVGIVEGRRDP